MSEKIPEVIYLQWYGLDERDMHNAKCDAEMLGNPYPDPLERTWCADRQYDTDVMYRRVRKQPKDTMTEVDKLEQTNDALIKDMDYLEERVAELEVQIDMHNSARQELLGRLEARDARIDELEDQLRDMTAACDLWKKKAIPDWGQTAEEPPLSTRTGLTVIKLIYDPQGGVHGRTIEVTVPYDNLDYVLENVRWFLSMVYMWDVGELELKQVEDEEEG